VPPHENFWRPEGGPTDLAFRLSSRDREAATSLSVHLAHLTTPEKVLQAKPTAGLVELAVAEIIEAGFAVRYKPLEGEPEHAEIEGDLSFPNRDKLRAIAKVVRRPPAAPG
jgi:hypothetical protein